MVGYDIGCVDCVEEDCVVCVDLLCLVGWYYCVVVNVVIGILVVEFVECEWNVEMVGGSV